MTPCRFNQFLAYINWSHQELALILGCDENLTRAWTMGLERIPESLASWVEALPNTSGELDAPKTWCSKELKP